MPKAVGNARMGLIDLQGMYAIVPASVSAATTVPPTPTPTPGPTDSDANAGRKRGTCVQSAVAA